MSIAPSVAAIPRERVTVHVERIDRLSLNVYVPKLQRIGGVVGFFREVRGATFASSALMDPISAAFQRGLHHSPGTLCPDAGRPAAHLRARTTQG